MLISLYSAGLFIRKSRKIRHIHWLEVEHLKNKRFCFIFFFFFKAYTSCHKLPMNMAYLYFFMYIVNGQALHVQTL